MNSPAAPDPVADLARRMHAIGDQPTHIATNPANVDAAIAAGLDVEYVIGVDPGFEDATSVLVAHRDAQGQLFALAESNYADLAAAAAVAMAAGQPLPVKPHVFTGPTPRKHYSRRERRRRRTL